MRLDRNKNASISNRCPWSDVEIETLREGIEAGETDAEISERLPLRSKSAVNSKRRGLGVYLTPDNQRRRDRVDKVILARWHERPAKDIAKIAQADLSYVYFRAKALGMPRNTVRAEIVKPAVPPAPKGIRPWQVEWAHSADARATAVMARALALNIKRAALSAEERRILSEGDEAGLILLFDRERKCRRVAA